MHITLLREVHFFYGYSGKVTSQHTRLNCFKRYLQEAEHDARLGRVAHSM